MKLKRDRRRKFTLKDGTTVEYAKDGNMQSKTVTSPCGASCTDIQLTRIVWLSKDRRNLYRGIR